MTTRPHKLNRDRMGGFLLIEALAVLVLSSLVLVSLLALGGGMSQSSGRVQARILGAETDGRAVEMAARDIARASRRRFLGDGVRFVFSGSSDQIAFTSARRDATGHRQAVVVAYQAAPGGGLMRAEGDLPILASSFSDVALSPAVVLASRGEMVRFLYIGKNGALHDRWRDPTSLPEAVRLERRDQRSGKLIASRLTPIESRVEPGCANSGMAVSEMAFCSVAGASGSGETALGASR